MEFSNYILVGFGFAGLFFVGAAYALYWSHKNGQLDDLQDGSKVIFDEEEPLGEQTDFFPGESK